jgi:hypothetical protein
MYIHTSAHNVNVKAQLKRRNYYFFAFVEIIGNAHLISPVWSQCPLFPVQTEHVWLHPHAALLIVQVRPQLSKPAFPKKIVLVCFLLLHSVENITTVLKVDSFTAKFLCSIFTAKLFVNKPSI